MRHAVLGMGGVGGLVAGALARAGDEVTAIVRAAALPRYPASLTVETAQESFAVPLPAVAALADDDAATPAIDVLWIAVKATQLDEALASVGEARGVDTVVPLLNGIDHVAALRARFGEARVVPATIAVEAERMAPGRIVQRSPFAIVSVTARDEPRLHAALGRMAASGITSRTFADEMMLLWSKLVFLAPMALTTSAAAAPFGDVIADGAARARLEACVREACAVAVASGATAIEAEKTLSVLLKMPATQRSSMQKDIAAGLPPELDAIAGPILRAAERYGIAVPATRELVAMVAKNAPPTR